MSPPTKVERCSIWGLPTPGSQTPSCLGDQRMPVLPAFRLPVQRQQEGGSCVGVRVGGSPPPSYWDSCILQLRQEQRYSLQKPLSRCPTPNLHSDSSGLHHTPHWPLPPTVHPSWCSPQALRHPAAPLAVMFCCLQAPSQPHSPLLWKAQS